MSTELDHTAQEDANTHDAVRGPAIGGVDMNLYDSYRQLDGQAYTHEYLVRPYKLNYRFLVPARAYDTQSAW